MWSLAGVTRRRLPSVVGAKCSEVAATGALVLLERTGQDLDRARLRGLANGVGEGEEVIGGRALTVVVREPEDLPAARSGESLAVAVAQVVGVWFGVGRQRADDGGLVGVHVGERGRGGAPTGCARTSSKETHDRDATTVRALVPVGSRS